MATTTATAAVSGTQSQAGASKDISRVQEIQNSTTSVLQGSFPNLYAVTNSVRYCMNIWQRESSFNLIWTGAGAQQANIVTGTGNNNDVPNKVNSWPHAKSFWDSYWNSTAVQGYIGDNGQTPEVKQGLYAFGISSCMGAYHINNTPACHEVFGDINDGGVADKAGLIVKVGTDINTLYPDTVAGRKKSITAGLIVLNYHFNKWKNVPMASGADYSKFYTNQSPSFLLTAMGQPPSNTTGVPTDQQAFWLASGSYLGWGTDINGDSGIDRAIYVINNTNRSHVSSYGGTPSSSGLPAASAIGCT